MAMISFNLEKASRVPRVPWWVMAVLGAWAAVIVLFNVLVVAQGHAQSPCLFKNVTGGVPCATCGSTRAAIDVARGDLGSALWRNPMVVVAGAVALTWLGLRLLTGYTLRLRATRTGRAVLWVVVAVAFFANWAHVLSIDGPWSSASDATPKAEGEAMSAPPTGG